MPTIPPVTLPGMEPPWMATARSLIGIQEVPGPETSSVIRGMLKGLHAWWGDDETPWCGTFVAHCLQDAGMAIPKAWYRAAAYADWGRPWAGHWPPPYGAIAVMPRKGGNHVAFYVGDYPAGRDHTAGLYLLGGNQDNQVCVRRYPVGRVTAWRWPKDYPVTGYVPPAAQLAALVNNQQSRTEA